MAADTISPRALPSRAPLAPRAPCHFQLSSLTSIAPHHSHRFLRSSLGAFKRPYAEHLSFIETSDVQLALFCATHPCFPPLFLLRRFQAHERKRDRLEVMRAQFEADKARIAKLRADRKFRPY